ncbi:immunoglobulin-like domain-containing protein [Paenibacillus silvisoli]|uniref:immunoglobulin-like domain-containing protein n=1 Tax=Paenibacillus silvisoli TaxID=3110539 RepID=UPI002804C3C2|nr:immunoglobulin-like domain-containing protein [Paenibacillus silvisoli]
MKKWTVVMLVLSMFLLGSGTALAKHGDDDRGRDDNRQQQLQSCKDVVSRLNLVLAKVKNERTRTILKKMIAQFKSECESTGSSTNQQDAAKANADKAALAIQFLGNDHAGSVTIPVILAAKGKNGSAITWTSSNPSIISNNGFMINRPKNNDAAVDLTAVIRYGSASTSKTFRVIVKSTAPPMADTDRVAKDKEALQIVFNGSDNTDNVTQAMKELPSKGVNGSSVTWTSTLPNVVSHDGKVVNRPANGSGDTKVVIYALIKSGNYSDMKLFVVTVKQQMPDAQKVSADKEALQIDFGGSDTINRVTRPLDGLPTIGVNGSKIAWTSSNTAVLSADGKTFHRPAAGSGDVFVALTAIITSGPASDVKVFILDVKPEFSSTEKVAVDKADLAIAYKDKDNAASVTNSIGLPTKGYYGSTIVWYSSNTSVLANNGTLISRPSHGKGDATVNLTAFISHNGVGDVKTFTVVVKQY